jgi:hypothetical protein
MTPTQTRGLSFLDALGIARTLATMRDEPHDDELVEALLAVLGASGG